MKRFYALICAVIISAAALCSCSSGLGEKLSQQVKPDENSAYNFNNGVTAAPSSYASYKNSTESFAFAMLKSAYSSESNTFVSSAGLYSQLSLLLNASSGSTRNELSKLLCDGLSTDELNSCNAYFFSRLDALNPEDKNSYLNIKSNLFFNKDIKVGQDFLIKNADFYNHGIYRLGFADNNAKDSINSYISEQTDKKAGSLIKELNSDCGIYSTNTAFMRDKWLDGYKRENVLTSVFKGRKGDINAEAMQSTEFFLKGKRCTGFEKDFKSTPCKFIALLPNEDINIYQFISKLTYEEYQQITSSMSVFKTCKATLPQFSMKQEGSVNNTLNNAGIFRIFNQKGDFSGLFRAQTARVGDVAQSAELSITSAGIGENSPNPSESTKKKAEYTVELNRPFVFMIVDNESYIPIYLGVVCDV